MTNEYSHALEHFREFANASRNLCRTLSLAEPHQNGELLTTIVSALQNFPDEVYEDGELIGILDALVDDGFSLDPYLSEPWGNFLYTLASVHLRRFTMLGGLQNLDRAIFLSELAISIVSREDSPRLWAFLQVLAGDSKRLIWSRSGWLDFIHASLEHYHKALEVIQRDDNPSIWVDFATRLARTYEELTTGDRTANLGIAAELFIRILDILPHMGSVRGVAEAGVALADVLAARNYNDQDIPWALASYHQALEMLQNIGDELAAEEVAEKIKALETVNFTTYYPRTGVPGRKYGFVVYAHLPELRNDVDFDAQKFSEEFGDSMPTPRRSRSTVKLECDTLVTVVPECPEVKFDPPEMTKRWDGSWTRFLFDFEMDQALVGEVVSVLIAIQVAGIEIASIRNCAIEVIESPQCDADENPLAHAKSGNQTSTLYQRIFVSYSRQDQEITERYKLAQIALGNETFIDVDDLRAGENWKAGLARAIDVVDVFQLFWSRNSANSEYCRYEWNYALEERCPDSKCEGFIRPVYWEKPMPDPPPELSHVNFKYVPFDGNTKLNENRVEGERSGQGRNG